MGGWRISTPKGYRDVAIRIDHLPPEAALVQLVHLTPEENIPEESKAVRSFELQLESGSANPRAGGAFGEHWVGESSSGRLTWISDLEGVVFLRRWNCSKPTHTHHQQDTRETSDRQLAFLAGVG